MCIKSITTYTLNYKINVLSIPPLKEWAFRTCLVKQNVWTVQFIKNLAPEVRLKAIKILCKKLILKVERLVTNNE